MRDIPVVEHLPIPPNAGKVTDALSRIGYKLEDAIADIVDNSIDASANNVLVRIGHDERNIRRIIIADDGRGMNRTALLAAMQFGSARERGQMDLGKFGMGLKTAAFSQGRKLTVISRQGGITSACRWTTDSIDEGWQCEILDSRRASNLLNEIDNPFKITRSGTVILIDDLDHLRASSKGLEATIQKIQKSLSVHLGLTFHRFLACGLQIYLDAADEDSNIGGFATPIAPLDPFNYVKSADQAYPLDFFVQLNGLPPLRCIAHIWPPNQTSQDYLLGSGSVAKRQGFYFYRNGRLIQGGGWNGWRLADAEPHLSLARVAIELEPEFDSQFRLNVQKSSVDVSEEFRVALDDRKCPMAKFVRRADEIYRKKNIVEPNFVPVPGRGFDGEIRKRATSYLTGSKLPKKEIHILWKRLSDGFFFEVDRASGSIYLNANYRQGILRGLPATLNDAPMVKTLLFLLLRDDLMRERESRQFAERIEQLNELLMLAFFEEQQRQ